MCKKFLYPPNKIKIPPKSSLFHGCCFFVAYSLREFFPHQSQRFLNIIINKNDSEIYLKKKNSLSFLKTFLNYLILFSIKSHAGKLKFNCVFYLFLLKKKFKKAYKLIQTRENKIALNFNLSRIEKLVFFLNYNYNNCVIVISI